MGKAKNSLGRVVAMMRPIFRKKVPKHSCYSLEVPERKPLSDADVTYMRTTIVPYLRENDKLDDCFE